MESITLEANPRSVIGKKVRALRREGITPLHLYGKGILSMNLQADTALVQRLVAHAGRNIPVSVSVTGTKDVHFAFIREVRRNPITEAILHVDFYQVPMAEMMRAQVPIYLTGEAPAVRTQGGIMLQALHSIEVDCLPMDMPQYVEVDVSGLTDFEQTIYVSSINLGDSVTIITDPSELIARVNPPRVVVAEEAAAVPDVAEARAEEAEEKPAPE
ncbi:50S ribosomal protein L25 [Chloroflexota bacterium]